MKPTSTLTCANKKILTFNFPDPGRYSPGFFIALPFFAHYAKIIVNVTI